MPEAFRVDRGVLGEGRVDHNGSLIVKGVLTRTGVFTYRHTDKDGKSYTTRELRHPEDVFNEDAVASFAQAPVTDDHPPEGRVTPANVKRWAVGNLGDSLSREGPTENLVAADLIIRDDSAIGKALGRGGQPPKRFLSCGYKADVVPENGEYMGERYDHRQTNIRGNHVALVRNPRAGPSARLLLDSEDAMLDGDDVWVQTQEIIEQTVEAASALMHLDQMDEEQAGAVSGKIRKIAHEHPEWDNDQVVAVAHKMLGLSKDSADEDVEDEDVEDMGDGAVKRVIGKTSRGLDVHAHHGHNDPDDWSVDDHREAAYKARNEHAKLRDTLATSQQVGLGDEAEGKIKSEMKTVKRTHDHHKKEAMTLDSDLKADADGWMPEFTVDQQQPQAGESLVKLKRDAVTIGDGDNELHLDAMSIEVDDESEDSLEALLDQRDQLIAFAREQHADAEQARGERDVAMAQVTDPAKLDELAAERTSILAVAEFVGLKNDDLKTVTNGDIKRAVVAKRNPDLINDDSSDDYVQGCFNLIALDSRKTDNNKRKFGDLHRAAAPHREDTNAQRVDADADGENQPSYRQASMEKLRGIHSDTAEVLDKKGFAN